MADRYFDRMCHHRQHIADIRRTLGIVGAGERETLEAIAAALARAEAAERERDALQQRYETERDSAADWEDSCTARIEECRTIQRERDEARAKAEIRRVALRDLLNAYLYEASQGDGVNEDHESIVEAARKALEGT